MNLKDFIKKSAAHKAIRLIGPLLKGPTAFSDLSLPILYIDGGLNFLNPAPHLHFSIGDGDSSTDSPDLLLPAEKDYSDLEYGLHQLSENILHIYMEGFLGGRRDHELINFGVIHNFLSQRENPTRFTLDQGVVLCFGPGKWTLNHEGLFSILCLEDTAISLLGSLKYPFDQKQNFPRLSSRGLSNEASGEFQLHCDKPVFLFKPT